MRCAVVGAGRLGACIAAVLAANKQHVTAIDINQETVDAINAGRAPVQETGLDALMELAHPWLRATTSFDDITRDGKLGSSITFVVVPTPSERDSGRFSNVYLIDAVRSIGTALRNSDDYHCVVIVSTVMPGSTRGPIARALEETSGREVGVDVGLAFVPAFIALGSVIHDFTHPDLVLIGADDDVTNFSVRAALQPVIQTEPPWHTMSSIDAEITKLSLNCMVVTKIAMANMIGDLCEAIPGADSRAVTRAVGSDSRIGSKYFSVGGWAGGPCFPRDAVALAACADEYAVEVPIIKAVHETNRQRALHLAGRVVGDKRVGILGTAYKPDTAVDEKSLGAELALILDDWDVPTMTYDPAAPSSCPSAEELVEWADTIVVATAWPQFAGIDYGLKRVVDVWGILPPEDNIEIVGVSQ